jgi:hypothetical protein
VSGAIVYTFGTGERRNLLYAGDASKDDNNRLYVIRDPNPTGGSAIPVSAYTEANLTDVTGLGTDTDLTDMGYFVVGGESEKFITDFLIFAGHAIAASWPAFRRAAWQAFIYAFQLYNGAGRRYGRDSDRCGSLLPHRAGIRAPRISIAPNPNDDVGFINTSDGTIRTAAAGTPDTSVTGSRSSNESFMDSQARRHRCGRRGPFRRPARRRLRRTKADALQPPDPGQQPDRERHEGASSTRKSTGL